MSAPDEPTEPTTPSEQPPPEPSPPQPPSPEFRPGPPEPYAACLDIDYPEKLARLSTFFRLIWIIPIYIVLSLLSAVASWTVVTETGEAVTRPAGGSPAGSFSRRC